MHHKCKFCEPVIDRKFLSKEDMDYLSYKGLICGDLVYLSIKQLEDDLLDRSSDDS